MHRQGNRQIVGARIRRRGTPDMKTISAALFIVVYFVSTAFGNDALLSTFDRETLEKIRIAMEGIETLSGDFIEEKRLVMLKEPVVLKGRFYYIRPDRLRWEHLTPEKQGFSVSNGRGSKWHQDISKAIPFELDSAPAIRRFVDQVLSWIRGDFGETQRPISYRRLIEKSGLGNADADFRSGKGLFGSDPDHIFIGFKACTNCRHPRKRRRRLPDPLYPSPDQPGFRTRALSMTQDIQSLSGLYVFFFKAPMGPVRLHIPRRCRSSLCFRANRII